MANGDTVDTDRRSFLSTGAGALAGGALLARSGGALHAQGTGSGAAVESPAYEGTSIAHTSAGRVRGVRRGGVHVFKGIPYAASTAGPQRFMPPQKPTPWTGVFDATRLGPQSPQLTQNIMAEEVISLDNSPQGEDCLRLNVWTAGLRDARRRPVMVWFHGGGFSGGSGGDVRYDGTHLASKHDVVLVTVNERLNAFGFLYLGELGAERYADSGNAGMLDLVAALQWVRDNIAEFGGDASSVTIFGQSGGGRKCITLMGMPAAVGLFHRAIAQSGVQGGLPMHAATEVARKLMARLGLGADQVDELQHLPVERIQAAMSGVAREGHVLDFQPVIDQRNLPAAPFAPDAPRISAQVPLMAGNTLTETCFQLATPKDPIDDQELHDLVKANLHADDAAADHFIALYRQGYPGVANVRLYQILSSDNWLTADVAQVAERKAALQAAPAYVYHFEKTTPVEGGRLGAPHTLDIPYVFDNLDVPTVDLVTGTEPSRYALAERMSRAWTAFARTGNPNVAGLPHWTAYSAGQRAVMIFNDECQVELDPHRAEREAMTALHARRVRGA